MVSASSLNLRRAVLSAAPGARWLRPSTLGVLVSLAALAGCSKEAPAVSAEQQAPSPAVRPATPATAAAKAIAYDPQEDAKPVDPALPAAAKLSESSFELVLGAKGAYEVGKPAEAQIVLEAKDPYKVNEQYPYKFKLKEAPGLKFANLVVGKDQLKLEKKRATLVVPFTPEKAGKHTVAGQFAFSVCTDDKCLIERRELSLDIEAK